MRLRRSIRSILRSMGKLVDKNLSREQFDVLRKGGTEEAGSSELLKEKRKGAYSCAACGNEVFSSEAKFDSGSGWPSFYETLDKGSVSVREEADGRFEISCGKCGGHLGHVFDDGPKPTGKRFCVNGVALGFLEKDK